MPVTMKNNKRYTRTSGPITIETRMRSALSRNTANYSWNFKYFANRLGIRYLSNTRSFVLWIYWNRYGFQNSGRPRISRSLGRVECEIRNSIVTLVGLYTKRIHIKVKVSKEIRAIGIAGNTIRAWSDRIRFSLRQFIDHNEIHASIFRINVIPLSGDEIIKKKKNMRIFASEYPLWIYFRKFLYVENFRVEETNAIAPSVKLWNVFP